IDSSYTFLDDPLLRYYEDEINDGINPPFQHRKGFDLKDASFADLYVIPNHEASAQAGIPAPMGTLINRDWMSEDFVIASINTLSLQDDLYDFRFELYRISGGVPER